MNEGPRGKEPMVVTYVSHFRHDDCRCSQCGETLNFKRVYPGHRCSACYWKETHT